jgi:capreomycidine synthase
MHTLPPARLEHWMRRYYFDVEIDIGSSGVEDFDLGELRRILGITEADLDSVIFRDSETLGGTGLREAIARRWARGMVDRVMVTHGSSEAIFLLMTALLRPGDEVVALAPCYPQLVAIAEAIGCRIQYWPLAFEHGLRVDLADVRRRLNGKTRMVVVNFPHNPTGRSLTPAEQDTLLRAVEATGAYLVWDGAFADVTYARPPLPSAHDMYDRAVVLGTMSKSFGLPGLRVGWCLAAPDVLAQLVQIRDYVTLHLSPLVELIAQRVIEQADDVLARRVPIASANLQIVSTWMHEHRDCVQWVPPDGGVCAFPWLAGISDTERFCAALAESHRVLVVPGECFDQPGHVRLGFGRRTEVLREGLTRLSDGLRRYRSVDRASA